MTAPQSPTLPQRLKIAFVVDRFGGRFGGAEAYGVELMRQLASQHAITVFAREYDAQCDLSLPYVPIKLSSAWPSWIRSYLFARQAARLTAQGFDIVHSHMNGWCGHIEVIHVVPVRYQWRVRALPWLKRVTSYISPRVAMYLGLEKSRLRMRKAHRVVAVSGLIADQLQQAYGAMYPKQSYPIVPPGVQIPDSTRALERRQQVRDRFQWQASDLVCLLVARNPMRKGLPTALKALSQLPSHYKLLVVGGQSGLAQQLRGQLEQLGVADRVFFQGETSEVEPYYRAADIYVHPTLNDSFGMTPLEAMSCGLPVIISPSPWCGFAQYLEHDHHALVLSHPENQTQLAQYIRLLGENREKSAALCAQALELIIRQHSWQAVAQAYLGLYQAVLQEK